VGDVLVLCYHALSERWQAPLSVTPGAFERQLGWLAGRGYRGATFLEAVTVPPAARTVAVTFDDAFRSVYSLARPVLERLAMPATVFVPTDFPGSAEQAMSWPGIDGWLGGPHEAEMRPMSWEQLDEVAASGWEIGSHTRSHPRLTTLADDALAQELEGSRRDCEGRLGRPCRTLAYPYGDWDERVAAAAGRAGYSAAGTLPARLRHGGPLEWPRVGIYHGDDDRRFRLKASRALRLVRATPLWPGGVGSASPA
jgi:peptidoglycan/xylan/chitin deacetylase (PgdA/CDA1 family)